MPSYRRAERLGLIGLIWLFLLLGQAYALQVPAWEAPDEPWHLAYAEALNRGALPSPEETYEFHHPPLYYAWLALGMRGLGLESIPRDPDNLRYPFHAAAYRHAPGSTAAIAMPALRQFSGLLATLAIVLTWAIARRLAALDPARSIIAMLAAVSAALLPQYLFIGHMLSNDGLATLAGGLACYAALRWLGAGSAMPRWLVVGGALLVILGLMSKLSVLPVLLVWPLVLGIGLLSSVWRRDAKEIRANVLAIAVSLTLTLLALFAIDLAVPTVTEQLMAAALERAPVEGLPDHGRTYGSLLASLFSSAAGRFGWFNVTAPKAWSWAIGGLALFALVGLLRAWPSWRNRARLRSLLLLSAVGLMLAAGLRNMMIDPQAQIRLFFPALPAFAALLAMGLAGLLRRRTHLRAALALITLAALAANAQALTQILPRAYSQTPSPDLPIATRMLPASWKVGPSLAAEGGSRLLLQTIELPEDGAAWLSLPILAGEGSGILRLRASIETGSESTESTTLATTEFPLSKLVRVEPDAERVVGPLADTVWVDLDLDAGQTQVAGRLRLDVELLGDGRAWLISSSRAEVYPEGELSLEGKALDADLAFNLYRPAPGP